MTETLTRLHVADPLLEANLCDGTRVLQTITSLTDTVWGPYVYDDCPGCVGCDYDTVAARRAAIPADVAFSRFPCDDDEEF